MRISGCLVVVAMAAALSGCGGGSLDHPASGTPPSSLTSTPSATARPTAPYVDKPCPVGAKELTLRGAHGTKVDAYAIGSGSDAVILEHGSGQGYGACDGWSFGTWLAATQHVRVLLVTRCPYDGTTCPHPRETGAQMMATITQPAVDYLHRHGARRVTLIGASSGAADVIQAGGVVHGVAAAVALSPDVTDTDGPIVAAADRLPTLIAFATKDRYSREQITRGWFRAVTGHPKRLVVFPDSQVHGWNTVLDDNGDPIAFADTVAAWAHGQYG